MMIELQCMRLFGCFMILFESCILFHQQHAVMLPACLFVCLCLTIFMFNVSYWTDHIYWPHLACGWHSTTLNWLNIERFVIWGSWHCSHLNKWVDVWQLVFLWCLCSLSSDCCCCGTVKYALPDARDYSFVCPSFTACGKLFGRWFCLPRTFFSFFIGADEGCHV